MAGSASGGTATWTAIPSLAAGASVTVHICGQVSAGAAPGATVENCGNTAWDPAKSSQSCAKGSISNRITGTVYVDQDNSGGGTEPTAPTAGDLPLEGVTVSLYVDTDRDGVFNPAADALVATRVTGADGRYSFSGLCVRQPGKTKCSKKLTDTDLFFVVETDLFGFTSTGDEDTSGSCSTSPCNEIPVTLSVAGAVSSQDFFDIAPGSIGDRVWLDVDGDGVQDVGEPGLANVSVGLTGYGPDGILGTADDVAYAPLLTGVDGGYRFRQLPPGKYRVDVDGSSLPGGLVLAPGGSDPLDVVLGSGQHIDNADFGYTNASSALAVIGDRVWQDFDGDGVQDPGEPGIPGVTLDLIGPGADGLLGTADDVVVATATTADRVLETYRDNFDAVSYTNSDGTLDWSGDPWVESNDPGTPPESTGSILVTSGGELQLRGAPTRRIRRRVDLTRFDAATLSFDFRTGGTLEPDDVVRVEVSADGVTYALLQEYADDQAAGTASFDLSAYAGAPAFIRFSVISGYTGGIPPNEEAFFVDNLTIEARAGYLFTGIPPGRYRVDVTDAHGVLTGLTLTTGPQSNPDPTLPILVGPGQVFLEADFGYRDTGLFGITDRVWYDADADGVLDAGESGMGGVSVDLLDASGRVIASTSSGADGTFAFTGLPPGTYTIRISDAARVLARLSGTTSAAVAGELAVTIVASNVSGVHFGYVGPGVIGDTVFSDFDGDGVQDPGEPGIAGVTVELWRDDDGSGNFDSLLGDGRVRSTTTDAAGHYLFTDLDPALYFVSVDDAQSALSGYAATTTDDETGANAAGTQIRLSLASGQSRLDADFGYRKTALPDVLGTVFEDRNINARHDAPGEGGFAGVTVALLDAAGNVAGTVTTDAAGDYIFRDVAAGSYTVAVTDGAGILGDYTLTTGLDRIPVTVASSDVTGIDFGYVRSADRGRIGDRVWLDADRDGVQDQAEGGIPGIVIELYLDDGDATFDAGDTLLGSRTTSPQGLYVFTGLDPGNYFVNVASLICIGGSNDGNTCTTDANCPGGFCRNSDLAGLSQTNTSPAPLGNPHGVINLAEGETYPNADFGYAPASAADSGLGDFVWYDADADGVQDPGESGIAGVDLIVTGLDSGTDCNPTPCVATTDATGRWFVPGLTVPDATNGNQYRVAVDTTTLPAGFNTTPTNGDPTREYTLFQGRSVLYADFGFDAPAGVTATIGDSVFFDGNANGTQDGTCLGGTNEGAACTSDPTCTGGGSCVLEEGIADVTVELLDAAGNVLASTTTNASGAYDFSGVIVPGTTGSGDYRVRVTDVHGALVNLTLTTPPNPTALIDIDGVTGFDYNDADFGYTSAPALGTIGTQFWHDLDRDGIFEPAAPEPGFQGVSVDLWLDVNGNGTLEPGIDNRVRRAYTRVGDGHYEFLGLPFAKYVVDVSDVNGVLAGFTHIAGPSPGADNNSQAIPYAVTITASSPSNFTADFGFAATTPHVLSGTVFRDVNGNGATTPNVEPGLDVKIPGIPVYLYRDLDSDGVLDPTDPRIGVLTTDANGFYSFADLPDGDYIVQVDATGTRLDGMFQTTQQNQSGQLGVQNRFSPNPATIAGADSTGNDFGFFAPEVTTTPVTLAWFVSQRGPDGRVHFEWATATEAGNVGFRLLAEIEHGGRLPLHADLVPSYGTDSVEPQFYELDARTEADRFVLEDVDVFGKVVRHGPFILGQEYGEPPASQPVPWQRIRSESRKKAAARRSRVAAARGTRGRAVTGAPAAELRVDRDAIYRVTYEDLRAAGVDLAGVRASRLRLESGGRVVPIYVHTEGGGFGPGSWIEFYGEASRSLYTREGVYHLQVGHGRRVRVDRRRVPQRATAPSFYIETRTVEHNRRYSFAAPNDDPWFDERLLAFSTPVALQLPLEVDAWAPEGGGAELQVDLWGVTDLPQHPDHHVQVEVNGQTVAEARFDGLRNQPLQATVTPDLLHAEDNVLRIVLPADTGARFDLVHYDRYTVRYPRRFEARGGELTFTAAGKVFEVSGLPSSDVVVYRFSPRRRPRRLVHVQTTAQPDGTFTARFHGDTKTVSKWVVTTASGMRTPRVSAARPRRDLLGRRADYLVIAHPDFVDGLQPLLEARRRQGLDVLVVDVRDVYDAYSHGVVDPEAIQTYIAVARRWLGVRYVLLVGADSYDYRDDLGLGAVSFLPTLYAQTHPIVHFAPVDSLYGDTDRDGVPDLPVGRLPVRTSDELAVLIDKILAYQSHPHPGTAVLAADRADGDISFSRVADRVTAVLGPAWGIDRADIDRIGKDAARQALLEAFDGGPALVGFVGHSGLTVWSFERLFQTSDVDHLSNAGAPALVTQWGCWNTYYVSPLAETLGHRLLLAGPQGAAAVVGASALTLSSSEEKLGPILAAELARPGRTLGDALIAAKQKLARSDPALADVLLGWNLLGDPALPVAR